MCVSISNYWVCPCVYVCVYTYIYTHKKAQTHIRIHTYVHTQTYIDKYVYMWVCVWVFVLGIMRTMPLSLRMIYDALINMKTVLSTNVSDWVCAVYLSLNLNFIESLLLHIFMKHQYEVSNNKPAFFFFSFFFFTYAYQLQISQRENSFLMACFFSELFLD